MELNVSLMKQPDRLVAPMTDAGYRFVTAGGRIGWRWFARHGMGRGSFLLSNEPSV
jgi:hypothetical protein